MARKRAFKPGLTVAQLMQRVRRLALTSGVVLLGLAAVILLGPKIIILRLNTDDFSGGELTLSGQTLTIPEGSGTTYRIIRARAESGLQLFCNVDGEALSDEDGYLTRSSHQFVVVDLSGCEFDRLEISWFP